MKLPTGAILPTSYLHIYFLGQTAPHAPLAPGDPPVSVFNWLLIDSAAEEGDNKLPTAGERGWGGGAGGGGAGR